MYWQAVESVASQPVVTGTMPVEKRLCRLVHVDCCVVLVIACKAAIDASKTDVPWAKQVLDAGEQGRAVHRDAGGEVLQRHVHRLAHLQLREVGRGVTAQTQDLASERRAHRRIWIVFS